jgi:hypothetical protein
LIASIECVLLRRLTEKTNKMKFKLAISLIVLAALTRFLPHPPNFTPLGAMGLFGAAYFGKKWMALAIPFISLFLGDLVLNNIVYKEYFTTFTWITSPLLYLSFAAVVATGWLLLRNQAQMSPAKVIGASLSASVVFFLISNFSTWLESGMYPKSIAGLMTCYAAGIPFFGNTVMGDLFFSGLMFGIYEYVTRKKLTFA